MRRGSLSSLVLLGALALSGAVCNQAEDKPGNQSPGGGAGSSGNGPGGIPAAPTAVAAMLTEARVVVVTWQDNSANEQGFSVQRQAGSGDFREIARVGANVTEFRDGTVSSKREYIYRIGAMDDMGRAVLAPEDAIIDVP